MDDGSRLLQTANRILNLGSGGGGEDDDDEAFFDEQAWETLANTFKEVQLLLNLNHSLIQRANNNHSSRTRRGIADNVALICEINSNIAKVVRLYSNLSADFSAIVHRRRDKSSQF